MIIGTIILIIKLFKGKIGGVGIKITPYGVIKIDFKDNENPNKEIEKEIKLENNTLQIDNLYFQKHNFNIKYTFQEANSYIEKINKDSFGTFNDWRIPTREELKTLALKEFFYGEEDSNHKEWRKKNISNAIYNKDGTQHFAIREIIDFFETNSCFWTIEKEDIDIWRICFAFGYEKLGYEENKNYLIAVRGELK